MQMAGCFLRPHTAMVARSLKDPEEMANDSAPRLRELPAATDARARLTGIALMSAALFCFALLDTTGKWLTQHMPVMQVVWARYASHFVLGFLFINPWTVPGLFRTQRPVLQIARSALLVLSTAINFIALRYLQLDETTAIMFTTPFFIALFAGPILGEWIGWRRWIAILIGFAGALVVIRPGTGALHPIAFLALAGSCAYALYNISTRALAPYDSTQTTITYSAMVGVIASTLPLPWIWQTPTEPLVIGGMVLVGAFGLVGHTFLIMAHRFASAGVLAPFMYLQIVWVTASGFIVFGHVPTEWTLVGAGIVIASGLYLLYRERRKNAAASLEAQSEK
jgi:drug/metabolite transporter (DMT)-like permease